MAPGAPFGRTIPTITGIQPARRSPIAADIPAIPSPTTNALFAMAVTGPYRTGRRPPPR